MRGRIVYLWVLLGTLAVTAAWAGTATYKPPKETGTIYTVIKYKWGRLGTAQSMKVSVAWGRFNKSGTFSPPATAMTCGVADNAGIVLVLRHTKPDQVLLTVDTDGTILSIKQGTVPSQYGSPCYKTINW